MSSLRSRALSLYRRLWRAAREWQGDPQEAEYIRQEARQQFRANRLSGKSEGELAKALEEGENRLQIALHYGIAYPRLWHADQFAKVPYVQAPKLESDTAAEEVASGIKDAGVAAKLAAAAQRRKQRLAAQQQQQQQPGEGET